MFVTLADILLLSVHGTRTKSLGNLENFRDLIQTLPGETASLGNSCWGLMRSVSSIALGIARNSASQFQQVWRTEPHAQGYGATRTRTVDRGRARIGKWILRVRGIVRPQAMRICNDACTFAILAFNVDLWRVLWKEDSYVQLSLDFKSMRVRDWSCLTSLRRLYALSHYVHGVILWLIK